MGFRPPALILLLIVALICRHQHHNTVRMITSLISSRAELRSLEKYGTCTDAIGQKYLEASGYDQVRMWQKEPEWKANAEARTT